MIAHVIVTTIFWGVLGLSLAAIISTIRSA